jgi:cyanophycinase
MHPRHLLIVAAAILAAGCATVPPQRATTSSTAAAPGRLVIIGGGLSSANEAVYRAVLDARQGPGPFCIIPTAGATPETAMDGPVANFERYAGPGTARGVLISMAMPETASDPAVVQQLLQCSGFFFIGGVQSRITAAFRPQGRSTPAYEALMRRWREGAVVSGSSAGAAIMSDPMIAGGTSAGAMAAGVRVSTGGDDDDSAGGLPITPGLGFFQAALTDQHFLARGRIGRLLVATAELPQFDLAFGVDENTALVVQGDSLWAVGASGVVIVDERGAQVTRTADTLRAFTGMRVHLMSGGDHFRLAERRLVMDSAKRGLPPAVADSATVAAPADLYARWEFMHLLVRLGRTQQRELSVPTASGTLVLRKGPGFSAGQRADGTGVENAPPGLSVAGLLVDYRRAP